LRLFDNDAEIFRGTIKSRLADIPETLLNVRGVDEAINGASQRKAKNIVIEHVIT